MENRTYAEINLDALRHNFRQVRQAVPPATKIMSVVKANAYGHGLETVSRELVYAGTDYLAVANTQEAIQLRNSGIGTPILVFGNPDPMCANDYFDYDLDASLSDLETAVFMNGLAEKRRQSLPVHLKVDTGMGRYGLVPDQFKGVANEIFKLGGLSFLGMWTHFPNADHDDLTFTHNQITLFYDFVEWTEKQGLDIPMKHLSNSAGTLFFPDAAAEMVRPGLLLYGYAPGSDGRNGHMELKPVMKLKSHISLIKPVQKGWTVSYGSRWKADSDTTIGVIPIGYADGVSRMLENKMKVDVNGNLFQQVGAVTMDNIMIDLGHNHQVEKLDEVVLFGNHNVTAAHWASWAGTITWEILCSITGRVPRVFRSGKSN